MSQRNCEAKCQAHTLDDKTNGFGHFVAHIVRKKIKVKYWQNRASGRPFYFHPLLVFFLMFPLCMSSTEKSARLDT